MSDNISPLWIFSSILICSLLPMASDIAHVHVESLAVHTRGYRADDRPTIRPAETYKKACHTCLSFANLLFNYAKRQTDSSVFKFEDLVPERHTLDCQSPTCHLADRGRIRGWLTCDYCGNHYCNEICLKEHEQGCIKETSCRGYYTPTPSPEKVRPGK